MAFFSTQLFYVERDKDCLGKFVLIFLMSAENRVKLKQKSIIHNCQDLEGM